MIGRVLAEKFKIVSLIARGGMGKVYRAEQAPLGRTCAVKVLTPPENGSTTEDEFRKRFFLEASIGAKLTHPNTVTIFDYGVTDGPWQLEEDLRRVNALVKYSRGEAGDGFAVTASAYDGRWNSTDQIPGRVAFELKVSLSRPRTRAMIASSAFIEDRATLLQALGLLGDLRL